MDRIWIAGFRSCNISGKNVKAGSGKVWGMRHEKNHTGSGAGEGPWNKNAAASHSIEAHESDVWFPNDVVKANTRGDSLIKAWREYFKLTQAELAARAGMKQSALARLESGGARPRKTTLATLAGAMKISIEQLVD